MPYLKRLLIYIGHVLSERRIFQLYIAVNYILLGHWYKVNDLVPRVKLKNREALFEYTCTLLNKLNSPICYLEFGVKKGESIEYFSRHLGRSDNIFFGFDSFSGLPEKWDPVGSYDVGALSVDGNIPILNDERVRFVKGYFDVTLPRFDAQKLKDYGRRMFMIDSDLYSSAVTVLNNLGREIAINDYVYFDNMNRIEHEPKAFSEFIRESGFKFQLIASDTSMRAALFQRVEGNPLVN